MLSSHQNQGYESHIMRCFETEIAKMQDTAILDASLPAVYLYEHRGYKTVGHGTYALNNNVKLVC